MVSPSTIEMQRAFNMEVPLPPTLAYAARRGERLKDDRYIIRNKLGGGVFSEVYMVEDVVANDRNTKFLACKILTTEATRDVDTGQSRELESMQKIAKCPDINGLPVLRDHFRIDGPHGQHLCLVTDLLGPDLASLRRNAETKALPVYLVRNIIALIAEALIQLRDLNIVHTDIKPSNILLVHTLTDEEIERWLETVPDDGKSHPLPSPIGPNMTQHAAEVVSVVLSDLGQSQRAGEQPTVGMFSAYSLRAPEVLLHSDFGPNLDIWAVGCVAFELLTGRWMFHPEADEEGAWSAEDDHLAKMLEMTGETFPPDMQRRSQLWNEYFDTNGNLHRIPDLCPVPIETALGNYENIPRDEVQPAANFIQACCRLNPFDRLSAHDLEMHGWLAAAFSC